VNEPKREWFEKDYYKILGVSDEAPQPEITKAYRQLARELHPDANPGNPSAEEKFKAVSAAYDVVGDEDTRSQYDEVRRMGPMGGGFGPSGPAPGPDGFNFQYEGGEDLGDLFSGLFGGGRSSFGRPGGPRKGRDQEAQIRLSFEEAVNGLATTVSLTGSPGNPPRDIKVRIPSGVDDGQRIRLKEQGGPGADGGPPGDLFVITRVGTHKLFGRDGANLTLTLPITFAEAALGADISVPTFDGESVKLRIPAGTQSAKTFRVRGRGVRTSRMTGDLLVTVEVAVPTKLSSGQRKALEEFADLPSDSPRAHLEVSHGSTGS
jgi:molecular chaperone DnaJ